MIRRHKIPTRSKQAGFTIIELLIATVVFSVILLIVTVSVIQFSKQYYKGIIAGSTQGAARTLIDDVSRAIQFNSGGISQLTSGGSGWCIGTDKRYSYALNRQVIDTGAVAASHQGVHGLVSDTVSGCSTATPALGVAALGGNLTTPNARELLGQHMRLAKFDITGSADLYTITVRIIYGDDDLLCSPSTAGDCADPNSKAGVNAGKSDLMCRSTAGSQYCAVSELSTTVTKRVNG